MKRLGDVKGMKPCSIDPSKSPQENIKANLRGYSFNGLEMCRCLNGLPPRAFRGCYYTAEEKPWWGAKGVCKREERGCDRPSTTTHGTLDRMVQKGELRSTIIRWFDGRASGEQFGGLPTDVFRMYYLEPKGFARRLKDDADIFLEEKYGSLKSVQKRAQKVVKR